MAASPAGVGARSQDDVAPHVVRLDGRRRSSAVEDGRIRGGREESAIRVLLVTADEEDQRIVQELLARAEHDRFRLEWVVDAEVGLERLAAGRYDVALVDGRLPGCHGLSLLRRAIRLGVETPMIVLCELGIPDLELEAIEAGAADLLDKEELDVGRLERAIRIALARKRHASQEHGAVRSDAATAPSDRSSCGHALAERTSDRSDARGSGGRSHDARPDRMAASRAGLARELARALESGEITAQFQPQVMLRPAELGLAVVPRWHHATLGTLEGRELATLAAAGPGEALTDWLIDAACRQARSWREGGLKGLHIAVPLPSCLPLARSRLAERVEALLAATGLPADRLELECDERLLLEELEDGMRMLLPLRELGVRLAVGGLGAGPISLAVLRDAPLRTVKLGRLLLRGMSEDRRRALTASAVMTLARQLGLRLVAEGVESQNQIQLLRAEGCDAVQSPLSCPPLPADACTDWLRLAARRG
ncbi:EAL domain-containing protein [Benzoatithermus flavus]|uniref:EAL domain-containing response regulator n=1 Tax=Benzoatithermus flavus TaxID=3108223 RepID=A0ABU8XLV2_9PROT